ncbi:NusG domain II-containing protein [bacterium]|nr:NusG domain II-containing protein [bacterium]
MKNVLNTFKQIRQYLKPGDIIIALVWAILFFGSLWLFRPRGASGDTVCVYVDGKMPEFISLKHDTEGVINGRIGELHYNIKDGELWITHASCPQKHCIHFGRIEHPGEAVFCIPNRIVIEVVGHSESGIDAITM